MKKLLSFLLIAITVASCQQHPTESDFVVPDRRSDTIMPADVIRPSIVPTSYVFPTTKILDNGNDSNKICLVFMGDGYTESEQAKQLTDITNAVNAMFLIPPYSTYKSYFNVYAIQVTSNESGVKTAPSNLHPDTYFSSTFGYQGMAAMLACSNSWLIQNVVKANIPSVPLFDVNANRIKKNHAAILVNATQFGGSDGWYAICTNYSGCYNGFGHEFAHGLGNLCDEYGSSSNNCAGVGLNVDYQANAGKWKTLFPDAGWFSPANYCNQQGSPYPSCKMRASSTPFCKVCEYYLGESIKQLGNGTITPPTCIKRHEVQSLTCPSGTTGKWIQVRDSSCGVWKDSINTCAIVTPPNGATIDSVRTSVKSLASFKVYWKNPANTKTLRLYWRNYSSPAWTGNGNVLSSILPPTTTNGSYNLSASKIYQVKIIYTLLNGTTVTSNIVKFQTSTGQLYK